MDRHKGTRRTSRRCTFSSILVLLAVWSAFGPLAADSGTADTGLESRLGIPVYPGSELIALEGPALELVNLQRPGFEFTTAEVLVADFLVSGPITDLRRFYRDLCERDPLLVLVKSGGPPGEIIAVRYIGRHPLQPRKRWLRITTYRLPKPHGTHLDGE